MTHPHPKRSFVPQAVLTRSEKLSTVGVAVNTVRPVNTANTKAVNTVRPVNTANTKAVNTVRPVNTANTKAVNTVKPVNTANTKAVNNVRSINNAASKPIINHPKTKTNAFKRGYSQRNPQQKEYKEKAVIDNGYSKHMTGNKCYLDKYEYYDGRFISFGDGKGRISGKGKIKTGSLDFDDVYFCKELKHITGNKCYLDEYEDYDGGFVSSGDGKGRIFGKVAVGNKTNGIAGTKDNIVAGQAQKEKEPEQEYILIPLCITDHLISQGPKDCEWDAGMKPTEVDKNEASDKSGKHDQEARSESERLNQREIQTEHTNSSNGINIVSTPVSTAGPSFDTAVPLTLVNTAGPSGSIANESEEQLFERFSPFKNAFTLLPVPNISSMDNTGIFGNAYDNEDVDAELKDRRGGVCLSPPVLRSTFPDKVYKKSDGIFISQDKYVAEILKKFDFTLERQQASLETKQALIKDEEAEDVDVHLYRSMIGSLMYLTTSRPDIMFAVCACASDYAGASLDRKSTTGGCQFLGKRLISWQCKKQTIVANSTTKAEYVAAANCCGQVGDEAVHKELGDRMEMAATTASSLEAEQDSGSGPRCQYTILGDVDAQTRVRQLQALIDKKNMIITESNIRNNLHLEDAEVFINQQLGDMSYHKKIYVNPSNIKKIFANMKREGNDFSGRITPLFDTMMVQASEEVGEDSDHLTDSNHIPIVDQPSTSSQPKKKQKSKRKQRKEAEVAHDEAEHEESVPTPSNDPQPSGEDSTQLNDLMVLCTKLQKQVLNLEKAKSDQAIKIVSLKKRVDKLKNRRKFITTGLKRLKNVGAARRIKSSNDSLGTQEDASKQGRIIEDIDADVEVTLVNETQERQNEDLMFDTGVLDDDEVFVDVTTVEKEEQSTKTGEAVTTAGVEDSVVPTIPTTVEETLAQTLIEIKAAKPKAKGIVFHDLEKQVSKPTVFVTQPTIKDKGKGIMQEPERPLTKKYQVALDEDLARNIQAQMDAEIIEEERLERQKQEEANIALIESWENTQAIMEADRLLAERLQTREREELTDKEKRKIVYGTHGEKKKTFYCTKSTGKEKHTSYQELFDKEINRVNTFMAMSSKAQESNEKKVEGSEEKAKSNRKKSLGKKRAVKEHQQESPKRQKLEDDKETDEHEEVKADDTAELKKHLVIKKDDDIAIDVIPLATKPPMIVEYKLLKEGIMVHSN
ncbi:hypothetical protein Tco_1408179 [Tanacetum coccineum]